MTAPKESVAGRRGRVVRASDLAQMVVCEQAWLFEKVHGERRTMERQISIKRGQRLHLDYYQEGLVPTAQSRLDRLWLFLRRLISYLFKAWSGKDARRRQKSRDLNQPGGPNGIS